MIRVMTALHDAKNEAWQLHSHRPGGTISQPTRLKGQLSRNMYRYTSFAQHQRLIIPAHLSNASGVS